MIVARIRRFLTGDEDVAFESLALQAFRFQYERVAGYRDLCDRRRATPESVSTWRQVPTVPTLAFKTLELAAAPFQEVFHSSGTTAAGPSVHLHPYPDLYRAVIDASFPSACLGPLSTPAMLSLVPPRQQAPRSSLAFMVDHVLARYGGEGSAVAFGPRGVEVAAARSWLAGRQREGRPVLVLATAFALVQLLAGLDSSGLSFRLPAGSVLFETGGTKGRSREIARHELVAWIGNRLGIPAGSIVREYGMTELSSQCYTPSLSGGDPDLFLPPHWMRVRVLDPLTLEVAAEGVRGLLSIFDLANVGSAVHLLTEDLGVSEGGGFRLLGRAAGAELRGCSLALEELEQGSPGAD